MTFVSGNVLTSDFTLFLQPILEFGRDGVLAATYSGGIVLHNPIWAQPVLSGQPILAWGVSGDSYIHVVNPDGSDGGAWNSDTSGYTVGAGSPKVEHMAFDTLGRVLTVTHSGGTSIVARYLADGSLDTTWTLSPTWDGGVTGAFGGGDSGFAFSPDGRYAYGTVGSGSFSGGSGHFDFERWDLNAGAAGALWLGLGMVNTVRYPGTPQSTSNPAPFARIATDPTTGNIAIPCYTTAATGSFDDDDYIAFFDSFFNIYGPDAALIRTIPVYSTAVPIGDLFINYFGPYQIAWNVDGTGLWFWDGRPAPSVDDTVSLCRAEGSSVVMRQHYAPYDHRGLTSPLVIVPSVIGFPGLSRFDPTTFEQDYFVRT